MAGRTARQNRHPGKRSALMENRGTTAAEGSCKPRQAPDPAAPPRADMESAPTDLGNPATNRKPRATATHVGAHIVRHGKPCGRPQTPRHRNPCRGRCSHRPGNPAMLQGPREGHDPPLQTPANARSNRGDTSLGAVVGRDALIPPHPAAAQTPAGGMNPAPTDRGNPAAQPQTPRCHNPCRGAHCAPGQPRGRPQIPRHRNPCRGRCSHRPGNPVVTQGPAGGL